MGFLITAMLAVLFGSLASGSGSGGGAWQPPDRAGLDTLRRLCASAGVPEPWIEWLAFTARGESGWNNLVGLGLPDMFPPGTKPNLKASASAQANEARAAKIAYERNADKFTSCGHPASAYQFGSGGWFGMLPANGLAKLSGTSLGCLPPSAVFDPAASLVMALLMARALTGWTGYKKTPTWLNLRVGWGNPSAMGNAAKLSERRERFEGHRADTGLPAGWLDRKPPSLPSFDPVAMYEVMSAELRGGVA